VLAMPDVKKRIEELGMDIVASRPEQFDNFIQSEMKKWARVISEAKIEAE
jgi:tripartite-type tricarboxylate transporter receptor subunit TctC